MTDVGKRPWSSSLAEWAQSIVFAAGVFAYIYYQVDSRLLHHQGLPYMLGMSVSGHGLAKMAVMPGGLTAFVSAAAFQLYIYPVLGAALAAVVVLAATLATDALLKPTSSSWLRLLRFVPGAVLVLLFNQYDNPFGFGLGLAIAVAAAAAYVRMGSHQAPSRMAMVLALAVVVYYLAGGAALLLAAMAGVADLRARRPLPGVFCLVAVPVLTVVLATGLFAPVGRSGVGELLAFFTQLRPYIPVEPGIRVAKHVGFLPTSVGLTVFYVLAVLVRPTARASAPPRKQRGPKEWQSKEHRRGLPHWLTMGPMGRLLQMAIVLGATAGIAEAMYDRAGVRWVELDDAYRRHEWGAFLAMAREVPRDQYTVYLMHDVNLALYHTGRLSGEMFKWPQNPLGLILVKQAGDEGYLPDRMTRLADTAYELGWLNVAEHWCHELMQIEGDRPSTLAMLAKINIIKGQPEAAEVFLGYMDEVANDLEARRWARQTLARLHVNPQMSDDAEVAQKRACLVAKETHYVTRDVEQDLLELLEANPKNRMAAEYLAAFYLLVCEPNRLAARLSLLDELGMQEMPRSWQEAMVVLSATTGQTLDLKGRTIDGEIVNEFDAFSHDVTVGRTAGMGEKAALGAVERQYGDTYFYYYFMTRAQHGGGR